MKLPLPHKLGKYKGRQYYRFFVKVSQSGLDRTFWQRDGIVAVISDSAVNAIRLVQDEFSPLVNDPTEFECAGPKGGVTHRYTGYEGLIWAKMCHGQDNGKQLKLL